MTHEQNQSSPLPKIAVVTACFGGIDAQKPFPAQSVPCERIVFDETNSPFPLAQFSARMKARFFKLQAHKILLADYLIWIDGNVEIKAADFVERIIGAAAGFDIAIPRHPWRNCIYREAQFITESIASASKWRFNHWIPAALSKSSRESRLQAAYLATRYGDQPIAEEAENYARQGHPAGAGLWWSGLFARPCNERMNIFFDAWWDEVLRWSSLDQSSFAFLVHKFNLKINTLELGDVYNEPCAWLELHHHLKLQ